MRDSSGLTPKQQATELIKQAEKILLVTGREPNNDQLASIVALVKVLTKRRRSKALVLNLRRRRRHPFEKVLYYRGAQL